MSVYNISMQRTIKFSVLEYYHIYNRGTDKRKIFLDDKDYKRFILLLLISNSDKKFQVRDYWNRPWQDIFEINFGSRLVDIGAYCLMPNHFHLLIREKTEGGISKFLKKILTGYSMYFNLKYKRTGSLFEGVFKAEHIGDDRYLKYLFAYIHLNPIGIVESGWKKKEIGDVVSTKQFLNGYTFSSLLEYQEKIRPESVIINKKVFPEYFKKVADFDSMLNEFISWAEENRKNKKEKLIGEDLARVLSGK